MMPWGLDGRARGLLGAVLEQHASVREARVFGSRALGTQRPESDVDIALYGDVDELLAARIAGELDELPLPYAFDVRAYPCLKHAPLREHIDRVGEVIFTRAAPPANEAALAQADLARPRRG
jgi:predicted nucleotidyltransferase